MFSACQRSACAGTGDRDSIEFDGDPELYPAASGVDESVPARNGTANNGFLCARNPCRNPPDESEVLARASDSYPPYLDEPDTEEGYMLLEDEPDEEVDAETFVREMSRMEEVMKGLRCLLAALLLLVITLASAFSYVVYSWLSPEKQEEVKIWCMLASIPIVALLFTWFHIWLAIQMMFLPLRFIGCCQYRDTGMGIGWQGIVPRKAKKMATTAYDSARPFLDGPRDWLARIHAPSLVEQVRPQLLQIIKDSLAMVEQRHFPSATSLLPESVRANVAKSAVDKIQEESPKLWQKFTDLLADKEKGVDNDALFVKVFTENKVTLNNFFMTLGAREFKFIEHCGAAMGFVCGVVQLVAFNHLSPTGRAIFLPTTGFFLGILSNWAAITAVFKPCHPVHIRICGCHICTIQGLFLKRQQDVCYLYSKLLCEHFLAFGKVVNYLQTKPELWQSLKEAYIQFNTRVLRETMGLTATFLAPMALGTDEYDAVEEDIKKALVKGLAKSTEIHKIGGRYIGKTSNIEKNNCAALQKMPPDQFENLLHPVFQEDEWILILLGGILGAIVGVGQVFFLRF